MLPEPLRSIIKFDRDYSLRDYIAGSLLAGAILYGSIQLLSPNKMDESATKREIERSQISEIENNLNPNYEIFKN